MSAGCGCISTAAVVYLLAMKDTYHVADWHALHKLQGAHSSSLPVTLAHEAEVSKMKMGYVVHSIV